MLKNDKKSCSFIPCTPSKQEKILVIGGGLHSASNNGLFAKIKREFPNQVRTMLYAPISIQERWTINDKRLGESILPDFFLDEGTGNLIKSKK
jgi:hypothetical protein